MSAGTTVAPVALEPAAQQFAAATANPPYLFDLSPAEGRKTVDEVQSGETERPDVGGRCAAGRSVRLGTLRPGCLTRPGCWPATSS
jgi:hypothetical protein